jgi:hypothetical protein
MSIQSTTVPKWWSTCSYQSEKIMLIQTYPKMFQTDHTGAAWDIIV